MRSPYHQLTYAIEIERFLQINFWSDSFQQFSAFDPPVPLHPGEQVQVTCEYDTSKRPDTRWGLSTADEMCMGFVLYWPRQTDNKTSHEINLCAYFQEDDEDESTAYTLCAENGRLDDYFENPSKFPQSENPAFDDTVGAPTEFSNEGAECTSESESELAQSPESESLCFPAGATTLTREGRQIRMDELQIGDEVAIGNGQYSTVFLFTHSDKHTCHDFLHISADKNVSITLTAGHYLYVSGKLEPARAVRPGSLLHLEDGTVSKVLEVMTKRDCGLFNPQTMKGDIVINGVVTSTYTEAVHPITAHSLLVPIRMMTTFFLSIQIAAQKFLF